LAISIFAILEFEPFAPLVVGCVYEKMLKIKMKMREEKPAERKSARAYRTNGHDASKNMHSQ
jgi:hypothetical protein